MPGLCKGKAHRPENLGYAAAAAWSPASGPAAPSPNTVANAATTCCGSWALSVPSPSRPRRGCAGPLHLAAAPARRSDQPDRLQLLMQVIAQRQRWRQRWRQQYEQARDHAPPEHPATDDHAA